jgi:hypothetical protein
MIASDASIEIRHKHFPNMEIVSATSPTMNLLLAGLLTGQTLHLLLAGSAEWADATSAARRIF